MNLQLENASELIKSGDTTSEETIGDIFVRCNNVLFVKEDGIQDESVPSLGNEIKQEAAEDTEVVDVVDVE